MKLGLYAGGLSIEGSMSSGIMAKHGARESGKKPPSATTRRLGMWVE
jgi:hypothetical protein